MKNSLINMLLFISVSLCYQFVLGQNNTAKNINYTDSIGRKQGIWVDYYNNIIVNIMIYRNDTLIGTSYSFYESGKLRCSIDYQDGVIQGEYRCFYENGYIKTFIIVTNGKREYFSKYNKKGELVYEEIYENGNLKLTRIYTENGIIEGHPYAN